MACPTRIILSAYPAQREGGFVSVHLMLGGDNPFPRRTLDVEGLAGCAKAFGEYRREIEAMGKGASIGATIAKGFRTPPGFKQVRWEGYVNLDPPKPATEATAAA